MDLKKGNFRLVFHDIFLIDFFYYSFRCIFNRKKPRMIFEGTERTSQAEIHARVITRTPYYKSLEKNWTLPGRHIMYFTISCCCHLSLVSRFVKASSNPSEVQANSNESFPELPILYLIYSLTLQVQRTSICNKISEIIFLLSGLH